MTPEAAAIDFLRRTVYGSILHPAMFTSPAGVTAFGDISTPGDDVTGLGGLIDARALLPDWIITLI